MPRRSSVTIAPDEFNKAPARWQAGDRFFFHIDNALFVFEVMSDDKNGLRTTASNRTVVRRIPEVIEYLNRVEVRADEVPDPEPRDIYWEATKAVSTP